MFDKVVDLDKLVVGDTYIFIKDSKYFNKGEIVQVKSEKYENYNYIDYPENPSTLNHGKLNSTHWLREGMMVLYHQNSLAKEIHDLETMGYRYE